MQRHRWTQPFRHLEGYPTSRLCVLVHDDALDLPVIERSNAAFCWAWAARICHLARLVCDNCTVPGNGIGYAGHNTVSVVGAVLVNLILSEDVDGADQLRSISAGEPARCRPVTLKCLRSPCIAIGRTRGECEAIGIIAFQIVATVFTIDRTVNVCWCDLRNTYR